MTLEIGGYTVTIEAKHNKKCYLTTENFLHTLKEYLWTAYAALEDDFEAWERPEYVRRMAEDISDALDKAKFYD